MKGVENSPCPICESLETRVFFSGIISGVRLRSPRRILKCSSCSQLFVNPVPTSEEIDEYHVREEGVPAKDLRDADKKIKKWNTSWRKFVLREYLGYGRDSSINSIKYMCGWLLSRFTRREPIAFHGEGKILDIGCNTGMYLYLLKNLGWQAHGVEIDPHCCAAARELGIDVFQGRLEDADFSPLSFDVIRFQNVLEHMPDPKQALKKALTLLKEGGRVYVSIPNTRSLTAFLSKEKWLAFGHIQGFSPRSMVRLCKDLDLKIKRIRFTSSRDRVLQAFGHLFKLKKDSRVLKNKFLTRLITPPFRFLLNITGLSDTFMLVLEK